MISVDELRDLALTNTVAEIAKHYAITYDKARWLLRSNKITAIKKGSKGINNSNYKHGQNRTRLYHIYLDMKQRCYNVKSQHYDNYGGRGIKICNEWFNDFKLFYNWSKEHGYTDELSIDRINVNGDYEPSNCRWITISEQQANRRSARLITYKGETLSLKEWAIKTHMNYDKLRYRLDNWSDLDKVFGD